MLACPDAVCLCGARAGVALGPAAAALPAPARAAEAPGSSSSVLKGRAGARDGTGCRAGSRTQHPAQACWGGLGVGVRGVTLWLSLS